MADEYALEISKQAVARACVALGYKETQISTLDCLADLVRHYIQSVSANTLEVSEISGRVHPGIQDVMSIFGDMSKPDYWKNLRDFAFENVKNPTQESNVRWSQPFPLTVPDFPERQKRRHEEHISSDRARGPHVPDFLPCYPPIHTYKRSIQSTKKVTVKIEDEDSSQRKKRMANIKGLEDSLMKIESSVDRVSTKRSRTEAEQ